jgi:hypothetical protein
MEGKNKVQSEPIGIRRIVKNAVSLKERLQRAERMEETAILSETLVHGSNSGHFSRDFL